MRIILPDLKYADALKDAGISTLFERRAQLSSHLFEDIVNKPPDHKLSGLLPPQAHHHNDLRSERRFNVPVSKTDHLKKLLLLVIAQIYKF
jgi:hypothetical protein